MVQTFSLLWQINANEIRFLSKSIDLVVGTIKNNLDRIFLMSSQRYNVNVVMTINHQKSYKYARHNAFFPKERKINELNTRTTNQSVAH